MVPCMLDKHGLHMNSVTSQIAIHALVTCGASAPDGDFLELPELDIDSLLVAWQEAVFDLYLAECKIEAEVVENMRTWQHTGFSIDQSVYLPAGDQVGIERLVQYIARCPFSLSWLSMAWPGSWIRLSSRAARVPNSQIRPMN